jgi:membrane-associated phospholipid phosphatase
VRRVELAVLCLAFAALAVAVSLGAFTWLDQAAVDHVMPTFGPAEDSGVAGILLPLTEWSGWRAFLAYVWLYPASVLLSGALAVVCARRLRRGWVWPAAWLAGTAIEVLVKETLARPALHQGALHLADFDQSLPSGHTIRSLLVAAAAARAFPRAARWVWAWAAAVWVVLVVQGWHVPTDVAAGLLLGAALALLADHLQRRPVDRGGPPAGEHEQPAAVQA